MYLWILLVGTLQKTTMEITLEKQDKVNASLKINLNEVDYKNKYEKKLKEYGRKVHLKGFRPGHVPPALIEKMYGKSILVDEINSLLTTSIQDYLKENKIDILGGPLPKTDEQTTIDWENQKDFAFTYKLGLIPEFELADLKSTQLIKYEISITDAIVKETVENLRKQFGKYTDVEEITEEDFIYAEAISKTTGKTYKCILPEDRIEKSSRILFQEKKVGDAVEADLRTILPEDTAIAHVLGIDKNEAAGLEGMFEFKIERISHQELADLDEEFYKKVFRTEESIDYETFENKIIENIQKSYTAESRNAYLNDVYEYILENTQVEIPKDFLKEWLYTVNEGKSTRDSIEDQFPAFEKSLKWDLIKNKVARDASIEVKHEEVLDRAKKMIRAQFGMMEDASNEMDELVNQLADTYLKRDNGKEYKKIFDESYVEKVLVYLGDMCQSDVQKVDAKTFNDLRNAKK